MPGNPDGTESLNVHTDIFSDSHNRNCKRNGGYRDIVGSGNQSFLRSGAIHVWKNRDLNGRHGSIVKSTDAKAAA